MKNRFRKLIRENHPDKAATGDKIRTELKFKLLHKIYELLTDPESKKVYDETGQVLTKSWCRNIRPLTESMLTSARKKYVGSKQEECDLIGEFIAGKGSMIHLLNNIPFMRSDDEDRIISVLGRLIKIGKIPNIAIKKLTH